MKQVVCLSSASWYPFPSRKQNVMSRLKDCDILYFDPPITFLAPLKDKANFKKLFAFKKNQPEPQDNITVYSLPPVLPFYNKFRRINKLNQRILAKFINKKIQQHGFSAPLLWCYLPSSCDILPYVKHSGLVYDCVDRHSAYGGHMNPFVVDEMEQQLAENCNVVFSTADGLHERLSKFCPNSFMIPNGADFELFSKASQSLPCPDELKNLPRPIFGFVGMLQACIDYSLIAALAEKMPQASIVFIGKPLPNVDLSAIEKYPNIHILGLRPHNSLPEYIAQFNVCLNVFKSGALSKHVSPLKFYEYLATGKPIVSTEEPVQVQNFSDVVYIAKGAEDFVSKCEQALAENDLTVKNKRVEYAKQTSWDARVENMTDKLKSVGLGW